MSMSHLTAHLPEPSDPALDNILSWLSKLQVFLTISEVEKENQPLFFNSLSSNVYQSLSASVQLNDIIKLILQSLVDHLKRMHGVKTLLFAEHYRLYHLEQGSQSFPEFANIIKERAALCSLGDFYEPALALVFTMGINDPHVRAKFLKVEDCTLDQALSVAQKHTRTAAETLKPRSEDSRLPVDYISIERSF